MEDHIKSLEKKIEEQAKSLQEQSKNMQALMQMMLEMKESNYNSPRSGANGGHYSRTPGSKREEHIETASNVEDTLEKKKKRKSKKRKPNTDEILDHHHVDNMETTMCEKGTDTTATVDQKREVSTQPAGDEKCTVPKGDQNMKITNGEIVSSGAAIISENTGSKREEHMETESNVEGTLEKKKKRKSKKRKPNSDEIFDPHHVENMETTIGEKGTDTTATVDQKREVSTQADGDEKCTVPKGDQNMKMTNGEIVSSGAAIISENTGSKREEHMETESNVEGTLEKKKKRRSKKRKPNSDEILDPHHVENMETTIGEKGTDTTATVDQKRASSTPASGDEKSTITKKEQQMKIINGETVLSGTVIISENTGSKREEHMETESNERVSVEIPTSDAKMVPKGEEHTKVANGDMGLSVPTNLDMEGTVKRKMKANSGENLDTHHVKNMETTIGETGSGKNLNTHHVNNMGLSGPTNLDVEGTVENQKKPNSGENSNTHSVKNMETTIGEMGTGKTATDTTESNKRKRETLENNNPASGDMVTVNQGLDTTKVFGNGQMGVSKTTYRGKNGLLKPKKYHKSNHMLPTLGEILNPQFFELIKESAIAETGNKNSSKINMPKLKNQKPEIVNIAPGAESTNTIADKGKKLIIFDINGLLADIVSPRPKDIEADKLIPKRAIFKRPFFDDFMRFCFERFNVAIWSSRTSQVLDPVVDFLFGDSKKNLLFVWDASRCTNSGMRTLEDKHKCIVFKNLRKIWRNYGPGGKWVKGTFHESNTLLLDDSPYKALINPKDTGLFPASYSYKNRDDNFLGPNGDLRSYLEGLAGSDDVRTYVAQHPFGQGDIDEQHPQWYYYSRVLNGQSIRRETP